MKADPKKTHVAREFTHTRPLISVRFDPTGKYVFSTSEDMTVQRFELATGKKAIYPATHDSWVRGLTFVDGGKMLITGGFDGRMMWWPADEAKPTKPIRKFEAHDGWIRYLHTSPDGKLVASGGNDHLVKVWNAADGKPVRTFKGHKSHVYSVLFHPDGKHLLSGDLAGELKQWELATGKLIRTFDAKALHTYNGGQQVHYGGIRSISVDKDQKYVAASGLYKGSNPLGAVNEPLVLLFDWKTGKKVHSFATSGVRGCGWRTVFHPEGFLVTGSGGSGGGYLIFFKPGNNKDFHKLKLRDTARDTDLHKDGIQIATIHYDRKVRISRMAEKVKAKPKAKKK